MGAVGAVVISLAKAVGTVTLVATGTASALMEEVAVKQGLVEQAEQFSDWKKASFRQIRNFWSHNPQPFVPLETSDKQQRIQRYEKSIHELQGLYRAAERAGNQELAQEYKDRLENLKEQLNSLKVSNFASSDSEE